MTRDEFMDKLERELAARRVPELPYWCGVLHGLARLGLVPIIASKAQKFSPAFYKRRRSPEAAPLAALRRARNAPILTKAQEGGKGGPSPGVPPYYRAHRSKKLARLL